MKNPERNGKGARRRKSAWRTVAQAGGVVLALMVTGCSDTTVRTYQVPKEEAFQIAAAHDHAAHTGARGMPHLHWDALPAGWHEAPPDGMRVANFQVQGPDGQLAEVAVIPLPGARDIELESVNLWRQEELGLPALTAEDLPEQGSDVQVGDGQGRLYDMASEEVQPGQSFNVRILGVVSPREEALWFVKMAGEADFVAEQKENLISFLQGLEFHGADAHSRPQVVSANTGSVPPSASLPQWTVPEHWTPRAPGSMLLASFDVSGAEGGAANVTVSKLSGDGGGLLANVNRWRGQVGLSPISPAQLGDQFTHIQVDGKEAPLVSLTGTDFRSGNNAQMLVAVVEESGQTWYYKIMGDPAVVEQEKATFIEFVQSAY